MAHIEDSDEVWRRIPRVMVVNDPKVDGGVRPSKEALTDDRNGDPMSVYCARLIRDLGHGVPALLDGRPSGWAVAELRVDYLRREEEQDVQHSPEVSAPEPNVCDPAHTLVVGEKNKARRERMAKRARIVLVTDSTS